MSKTVIRKHLLTEWRIGSGCIETVEIERRVVASGMLADHILCGFSNVVLDVRTKTARALAGLFV